MAPVEIRCDVDKLADVIRAANARMIAIDGCDGVGKTFLAEQLRNILNFFVLDLDSFLNEQRGSFVKNLKLDELKKAIQSRDARREGLIISGVCMLKVLSRINVSADMLIYVKRYSKYNTPSNLHILRCEDEAYSVPKRMPMTALHKELCKYHHDFKPSALADIRFVVRAR